MAQNSERSSGTGWSWFGFFSDAGIPPGVARKYSAVFQENRIRPDMLKDLDKEILQEMGVKAVGDILAIRRAAKDLILPLFELDPIMKTPSVFNRLGTIRLFDQSSAAGGPSFPSPKSQVTKIPNNNVPSRTGSKRLSETVQQPIVSSSSSSDKDKAVKVKSTVTKVPPPVQAPNIAKPSANTEYEEKHETPSSVEFRTRTDSDTNKNRGARRQEQVKERKDNTLSPKSRSRSNSSRTERSFCSENRNSKHRSSSSKRSHSSHKHRELSSSPKRKRRHYSRDPPIRRSISPALQSRTSPVSDDEEKRAWRTEKRERSPDSDVRDEPHSHKKHKKEKRHGHSPQLIRRQRERHSRTPSPFRKHGKSPEQHKRYSRSQSPRRSSRRQNDGKRRSSSPFEKNKRWREKGHSGEQEIKPLFSGFPKGQRRHPNRTIPPLLQQFSLPRPTRQGNRSNPQDMLANLLSLATREQGPIPKYSNYRRLQQLVPLPLPLMRPTKLGPQQQKDKEYLLRKQEELERKYSDKSHHQERGQERVRRSPSN